MNLRMGRLFARDLGSRPAPVASKNESLNGPRGFCRGPESERVGSHNDPLRSERVPGATAKPPRRWETPHQASTSSIRTDRPWPRRATCRHDTEGEANAFLVVSLTAAIGGAGGSDELP